MAPRLACVFLLPFSVHRAEHLRAPITLRAENRTVVAYPPFRNGDGLQLHRDVVLGDLPHAPGTAPPVRRLPQIHIARSPSWAEPYVLADGLRLDIEGLVPDADRAPAEAIGERMLRWVRLCTRQWWVLRGASEGLAPLQNYFPVGAFGQPLGASMYQSMSLIPWLGTEQLLSEQTFTRACEYLAAGVDVPLSATTLLDAVFSACHGDKSQAVLLAAIACEAGFSEQAAVVADRGHASRQTVREARKIRDLRSRVDEGARQVFGRSFAQELPAEHAALASLWVARHALAHGSPDQQRRNQVLADQQAFATAMDGAYAFFGWLASLWVRAAPDPMSEFVRPLVCAA